MFSEKQNDFLGVFQSYVYIAPAFKGRGGCPLQFLISVQFLRAQQNALGDMGQGWAYKNQANDALTHPLGTQEMH